MSDAPEAFEALFRAEYARLCRALSSFGDGAEEAVQEAFVKALMQWKRLEATENPAGWVRTVAVRRLLNERRSRDREAKAIARLGNAVVDPPDGHDLDIRAEVRELPPQQRIAVGLYYGGGYPVSEIAAAMDLADGTVKYHLHAARERLRAVLAEEHDGRA